MTLHRINVVLFVAISIISIWGPEVVQSATRGRTLGSRRGSVSSIGSSGSSYRAPSRSSSSGSISSGYSTGSDTSPRRRGSIKTDRHGYASPANIKAHITKDNYPVFTNIGGTYGALKTSVSKKHLIESDHFPPKSMYKHSPNPAINKMNENNMAAVSIDYKYHRPLITTGSHVNNPYMTKMENQMKAGDHYGAVRTNLEYYRDDPRRPNAGAGGTSFAPRHTILETNKSGVRAGLKVHQNNGLITQTQRQNLINEFGLRDDSYAPHFAGRDREQAIQTVNRNSG